MNRFKISMFVMLAVLFGTVSAFTSARHSSPKDLIVYANTKAQTPMPNPPPTASNGLVDVTSDYNSNPTAWRTAHCKNPTTPTCVAIWNSATSSYSSSFPGTYKP